MGFPATWASLVLLLAFLLGQQAWPSGGVITNIDAGWGSSTRRKLFSSNKSAQITLDQLSYTDTVPRQISLDYTSARRLLQQSTALPTCEIDLAYTVMSTSARDFDASITISNNRELGSNWQLVYRYVDYTKIKLANATGATVLSNGSASGAPVRLVDKFEFGGAAGIPAGGNYTFSTTSNFLSGVAAGENSLLINRVNVNGLQCSQVMPVGDEMLDYQGCSSAMSFFSAFAGASAGTRTSANAACKAAFCCGYVLKDPNAPPPPILPPPAPEVELLPPAAPEPEVLPLPLPLPLPPAPVPETPKPPSEVYPPSPPNNNNGANNSNGENKGDQGEGGNGNTGPLVGGVVAVAVLLLIAVAITGALIRRRRRQFAARHAAASGKSVGMTGRTGGRTGGGTTGKSGRSAVPVTATAVTATAAASTMGRTGSSLASALSPGSRGTLNMQRVTSVSMIDDGTLGPAMSSGTSITSFGPGLQPESLPQEVTLYEQLGAGAFGTVYRGEWGGRAVAVKVLQTICATSSKELESFRQEVAVLSRLRHPNIIAFLAACTVPPDICIIEELAVGGSLHTRLHGPSGARRRSPLPLRDLLQVAADIAEALVYLHPRVVHRDLKAQNVLLDGTGRAKVCDFGIAKFKDRTFVSTVNGQAGTPAYMAPELFDGGQVTEKVDVYSFGVLMWEMLTGRVPWADVPSPMQVIYYVGVLGQRPAMPEGCPPGLRSLIEACWTEAPGSRPPFREILPRLRELQADVEAGGVGDVMQPAGSSGATAVDDYRGLALDQAHTGGSLQTVEESPTASASSFEAHVLHSYASSTTATTDAPQQQSGLSGLSGGDGSSGE